MIADMLIGFCTCFLVFLSYDFIVYKLLLKKKVIWKHRITDFQNILGIVMAVILIENNVNLGKHIFIFIVLIFVSLYIGRKLNYIIWGDNREVYE